MRLVSGGKVDSDSTAVQIFAVESFDSSRSTVDVMHSNKTESTRSTRTSVVDDDDLVNGSDGFEFILEVCFHGTDGETKDT